MKRESNSYANWSILENVTFVTVVHYLLVIDDFLEI